MSFLLKPKVIWAGIALVALSIGIGFFGLLSVMIMQDRGAAWYPGAEKITNHDVIRVFPNFFYRQDATYKSQDDFTSVFNWYSTGFHLGPEKTAQSGCSLMYNTEHVYFVERIISVTVCNTVTGRMIFVQRTLTVNLR